MIGPVNASVISIESPVGTICIAERAGSIVRVSWSREVRADPTPLLAEAARQMMAYFAGGLREFDLPLDPGGGGLEKRVFDAMRAIPYGQTRTYGGIADDLGNRRCGRFDRNGCGRGFWLITTTASQGQDENEKDCYQCVSLQHWESLSVEKI